MVRNKCLKNICMFIIGVSIGILSCFKILEKNLGGLCELNDKYFGIIKIFSMLSWKSKNYTEFKLSSFFV